MSADDLTTPLLQASSLQSGLLQNNPVEEYFELQFQDEEGDGFSDTNSEPLLVSPRHSDRYPSRGVFSSGFEARLSKLRAKVLNQRNSVDFSQQRRGSRTSIFIGDDTNYRKILNADFGSPLVEMESLDYDVVDNRVFRERGRDKTNKAQWVVTICIGLVIGFVAYLMEYTLEFLLELRLHILGISNLPLGTLGNVVVYMGCAAVFSVVAGLLTIYLAPAATGAGVALVMTSLNGINVPHFLNTKTMWIKIFGTLLAVSSGLPVGPEGPLVHIGACISSWFTKQHSFKLVIGTWQVCRMETAASFLDMFRSDHDRRDFLSSGAAAGLAAAFGAPIGGVLFSLEEASSHWNQITTLRSVLCCTMATFVLTTLHEGFFVLGPPGLIELGDATEYYNLVEVPFFMVEAIFFGLLGAAFNECFKRLHPRRPKRKLYKILEILAVVLLCNMISLLPFFFPDSTGTCVTIPKGQHMGDFESRRVLQLNCPDGQYNDLAVLMLGLRDNSVRMLMEQNTDFWFTGASLLFCGVAVFCTLILACDLTLPAGLFMPSIFIGAIFGSLWGIGFSVLCDLVDLPKQYAPIQPGLYALVGATAMLAGTFRSAVSLVVIMLEGTGKVQYLLPLLIAVTISKAVGDSFNRSVYDMQIHMKRIPFLHPQLGEAQGGGLGKPKPPTAQDIMSSNVIMFEEHPLVARVEYALRTSHNGFPVVKTYLQPNGDLRHYFKGIITRQQLLTLMSRFEFHSKEEIQEIQGSHGGEPSTTTRDSNLDKAMNTFYHRHAFYQRHAVAGEAIVERMGLSCDFYDQYLDLTPFMNIAPLTVQLESSVWKVFNYFRTMGLRHIPVVDERNCVKGIITRKDFAALEEKLG